jgi:hypothetical protein
VSDTRESLRRKKQAYIATFCGDTSGPHPEALRVLADLKKFCGITAPGIVISPKSGMVDSHATTYRAGQRDVFMRIAGYLGIDERQLFQESTHDRSASSTTAES